MKTGQTKHFVFDRERLRSLQTDGFGTLALAVIVLFACAGLSLLPPLYRVWSTARQTKALAATVNSEPPVVAVFGKRLKENRPDDDYRSRLGRAVALYRTGHAESILLLGGITGGARISEAAAGADYLRCQGVPESKIRQEDRSRHTLENLSQARDLLDGKHPLLFVTNRYHLARCSTLATGFGLTHGLCAAEEHLEWSPGLVVRLLGEAFYLHWYWIGRSWSIATRNRKSLARIS